MKILCANLNILNIRGDGRDITKEDCSCISTVVTMRLCGSFRIADTFVEHLRNEKKVYYKVTKEKD